jgi:pyruvate dehydrogenase E1 component
VTRRPCLLDTLLPPAERHRPVVSVHDAASHSLAWIGGAIGARQYTLGVDRFGESGTIDDLYELTGIDVGSIVNTALLAISD